MPPTTRSRSSVNQQPKTTKKGHFEASGDPQTRGVTKRVYQEESHYFEKAETDENTEPAKVTTRGGRAAKTKRVASSQDDPEYDGRASKSKRRRMEASSASDSHSGAAPVLSASPRNLDGDVDDGNGNVQGTDEFSLEDVPSDDSHQEDVETIALPAHRDPEGHPPSYHHPLLLNNLTARQALLTWFDSATSNRAMPWRKPWIDPSRHDHNPEYLRDLLKKRAYEVWISEVMLQQTRVATVVDYWTRWMARWPTIHHLAKADHQEILDAWSGLGYYSRATRIHNAARTICADDGGYDGLLPDDPAILEAEMDGVGKYTAGAIAAIVFGKAVPLVDGNVLRVLSRQMGLFGDVQKDKKVADKIWDAAGRLARQVVRDEVGEDVVEEDEDAVNFELPLSDKPGQWGQALMELGSTICTPKPKCSKCPVTSTCRAYSEGYAQAIDAGAAPGRIRVVPAAKAPKDPDDTCALCLGSPVEIEELELSASHSSPRDLSTGKSTAATTNSKQISPFFTKTPLTLSGRTPLGLDLITTHAAKYPPKRTPKKQLPHHESRVIALRRSSDGRYLIQRRPATGLLPNMWELPSMDFPARPETGERQNPARLPWPPAKNEKPKLGGLIIEETERARAKTAYKQVIMHSELIIPPGKDSPVYKSYGKDGPFGKGMWPFPCMPRSRWVGELGIVPWTFSHLRLSMYVDLFEVFDDQPPETHHWVEIKWRDEGEKQRWASIEEIEGLTMGSGMRKCWGLVKAAEEEGW